MSAELTPVAELSAVSTGESGKWAGYLAKGENLLVSLALAVMLVLPLAEALLRRTLHISIPASVAIVQHMVLIVGMVGGAIAARERRLLALSNVADTKLKGWPRGASRLFTSGLGVVVCGLLAWAAFQFVWAERESGSMLGYGIPTWAVQFILPLGFAAMALRILWHTSEKPWLRLCCLLLAILLLTLLWRFPLAGNHLMITALSLIFVASVLGVPAFVTLGGTALILFLSVDQPIASIPIAHYALVTNPTLPTLPLFTVAGYFLTEGGSPKRLVRVFYALFGRFQGGPAIVTVLVCAFFTSFTGASGVTILALGGLLMPVLAGARFSDKDALGLLTGAGSLGLLLPPCLPLIVYAIVAKVSIEKMFLGGIVPALVMMIATALWGIRRGGKADLAKNAFDSKEALAALRDAKWELFMPIFASIALFSGLATPVEAAAATACYAFLVATVFHGEMKFFRDVPRVMAECGLLIGGVLLILGVSLGFTNYLVDAEIPARAVEWTTRTIHSPFLFLLLLNLFLLVVGCLMEIYPAIVVEVPLLVPLGAAYGIDPVRLGIIFLANMELGYLTPPVGLNLLMSSYRFGKPVPEVLRAVMPVIAVLSIGVLLITYIPWLTTALPQWLGR
jgi:tripartite ATP-independent transporter DctM subunit